MESLAPERFRISVDLGRYFGDARALSYMRVPAARRVRWLAARLARRWRLPLPGRLALASRGHLLPPGETLALLRPDDVVEVIPWGDDWFIDGDDVDTASEDMSPVRKQQMEEDTLLGRKETEEDTVPGRKQQMEEDSVPVRKQQMEEDTLLGRKETEEDTVPGRKQQMEEDTVPVRKQQMKEDTVPVRKQQMEEDTVPVRKQQMEEDTVPVRKQQKTMSKQQNPHENDGYNNHKGSQKEIIDDKTMEGVVSRSPVSVQSDSDDKLLEELKRSALALLEQCAPAREPEHKPTNEHELTDAPDGAAPRRRRRVRRRVRRAPHHLDREHDAQVSGSERAQSRSRREPAPGEDLCGSRTRGECESAVLRNGAQARRGGRAARVVRSLHELTHGSPSALRA